MSAARRRLVGAFFLDGGKMAGQRFLHAAAIAATALSHAGYTAAALIGATRIVCWIGVKSYIIMYV